MQKAVSHLKKEDPVLSAIIQKVGPFKMQFAEPGFHSLAEAIVYQQLHGKAAATIFSRFVAAAGDPLTPDRILKLSVDKMRSVGLSMQKTSYLRDMAERTKSGQVDFAIVSNLSDEEVVEHLTQVKGVGEWTAQMFLMFNLRRHNVLPTTDFGIRTAIKQHYKLRELPKPKEMEKIARRWEPYRSIACWYLWQSLDMNK